MTNPVLAALAQARMRDAPLFVRWCELNRLSPCPAAPVTVASFIVDCATLGTDRLWAAVQQISKMHTTLDLADPTLGGLPATAMNDIAGVQPPRSWPDRDKERFKLLPYDLQVQIAAHETRRERALRRAQNEAASMRHRLAALESQQNNENANGSETTTHGDAG